MIDKQCFSRDWILQQRDNLGGVDPTLLEKTILAYELLGRLITGGLSFVFKGGTCLLLLLKGFKRLSIDVDIVCEPDVPPLQQLFDAIIPKSPFVRWADDPRSPTHIPKMHYKFFFTSQINQREDYVLLDVLRSENLFPAVQKASIDFPFIHAKEKISVAIPTIDSLIGDKLTAFAPHTIGVPLHETRSMQVIKQLFDLGEMFQLASKLEEISASYNAFVRMGNEHRKTSYGRCETLQDTLETCFLISQIDLRKSIENETTAVLRRGIRQIGSHLIGASFGLNQAKIAASRVAFLAAILLTDMTIDLPGRRYGDYLIDELKETAICGERAILNRLKGISPEAYYYWHLIDEILKTRTEHRQG